MQTSIGLRQNIKEFADVDIYVRVQGTEDWLFVVSLDKGSGEIYDGEPNYSPDECEMFDVAEDNPPPEVFAAFTAARPKAVAILEQLK